MTTLTYNYPLSKANEVIAWWNSWILSQPRAFGGNAVEIQKTGNPDGSGVVSVDTYVLVPNTTDVIAKLDAQAAFAASTGCACSPEMAGRLAHRWFSISPSQLSRALLQHSLHFEMLLDMSTDIILSQA